MTDGLYWNGTAWEPIRLSLADSALRGTRYLWAGTDADVNPGPGGVAVESTGGQSRRIALSETDAAGLTRNPGLMLPGDTLTITDDPDAPPVTGFARYVVTASPVDLGTWWSIDAIRTDTAGSQTPPAVGTPVRVVATLSGGAAAAGGTVPIGAVLAYGAAASPSGWLLCDGRSTAGTALEAMMPNTPDLRTRFVLGTDPANGAGQGAISVGTASGSAVILESQLPAHSHVVPTYTPSAPEDWPSRPSMTGGSGGGPYWQAGTSSAGSGVAYWPRYYALTYIIRSD